jgi:hypothetical protein
MEDIPTFTLNIVHTLYILLNNITTEESLAHLISLEAFHRVPHAPSVLLSMSDRVLASCKKLQLSGHITAYFLLY